MPEDSNWSLIPHPGSGLARNESAGRRIISEMVAGALDHVKGQENALSHDILTAELWFQRGEAFYYGWNEPHNYEEAARCYRTASEKGHLDATCNLGYLYTLGLGVEKDDAESFRLFEHAAQHGHSASLLNLSHHYALGVGVVADARLAEAYLYLGLGKNDPARSEFTHTWSSKICTEAKLGVTEKMRDYDYAYRPARERIRSFITLYEALSHHRAAFDPLGENGMALNVGEASHEPILRKVRLVDFSYSQVGGQALVLEAHDSSLTCGDVLDLVAFEANAQWVGNEGGLPAEGILIQPANSDFHPPITTPESMIVGVIGTSGIELGENVHDLPRSEKIIGSLYQRGLGVPQSDEEAARWHADFSKRIKIGDQELCEPDYRQILRWAESLNLTPDTFLEYLLASPPSENENGEQWDQVDNTLISNGRLVKVAWNTDALPLGAFEWVPGLVIKSFVFWGSGKPRSAFAPKLPCLTRLICTGLDLSRLELDAVSQLEHLYCANNRLAELDLSAVPMLTMLSCDRNQLTELDLSRVPLLTGLNCCDNHLTKLDISAVPLLSKLDCGKNQLTELDLSGVPLLTGLNCYENHLLTLDLSAVRHLAQLGCGINNLSKLDLSAVPFLKVLWCQNNQITELDLSMVQLLTDLICHNNLIAELGLTSTPQLSWLMCSSNQLTKIDLTVTPLLDVLCCRGNQLVELDIQPCKQLKVLDYDKDTTRLIQRPDQHASPPAALPQ